MEVKLNFTKVPNQLLRHQEGVSAMEKLFLIYLLSHKKGYQLSDVQTADNLGMSRNTISKLKEKLSQEGYISYRKDSSRGYIYSVHLEKIILQKSNNEESLKNDCSPEYVDWKWQAVFPTMWQSKFPTLKKKNYTSIYF